MQKSTADVQKSRASPPATAFGACTQQLLCRVNPKYSRVQAAKAAKYSRAILPLVVTLLAINQRDAGSWVNQRHQISDVKVLFQIVVNQRHIICDVKIFKHNKNLSATRCILMGVKLSMQCKSTPIFLPVPPTPPCKWPTQDCHDLKDSSFLQCPVMTHKHTHWAFFPRLPHILGQGFEVGSAYLGFHCPGTLLAHLVLAKKVSVISLTGSLADLKKVKWVGQTDNLHPF